MTIITLRTPKAGKHDLLITFGNGVEIVIPAKSYDRAYALAQAIAENADFPHIEWR